MTSYINIDFVVSFIQESLVITDILGDMKKASCIVMRHVTEEIKRKKNEKMFYVFLQNIRLYTYYIFLNKITTNNYTYSN